MAGTAARFLEMARDLSRRHEVILASPAVVPGLDLGGAGAASLEDPGLADVADRSDAVLAQGYILRKLSWLGRCETPLVVDLYDPAPLENLELLRTEENEQRRQEQHETCLGFFIEQLLFGDFFLACHDRARDFWLGMLVALGRVTPDVHRQDPALRNLIDLLPTGVPQEPPRNDHGAAPQGHPAFNEGSRVLLWGGGIWDWLDAETPIRVVARLGEERPEVQLLFLGTDHPNPDVPSMSAAARARDLARDLGVLDRSVHFSAWTAYEDRQAFLTRSDLGLSLAGDHLEARFAWRSRLVDYLQCRLPAIVTDNDGLGEMMVAEGAALGVPPGDEAALRKAVLSMLDDESRISEMKQQSSKLAEKLSWRKVLEPLERFISAPRITRPRDQPMRYVDYLKDFLPHSRFHSKTLSRVRRVLDEEGPGGLVDRLVSRIGTRDRDGAPD